jgi:hypothetical protein
LLSSPDALRVIAEIAAGTIEQIMLSQRVDKLASIELKGALILPSIACRLNLPCLVVRKEDKAYGVKGRIVGSEVAQSDNILFFDDVITYSSGFKKLSQIHYWLPVELVDQLVLESEFLLSRKLASTPSKQLSEQMLIKLPGTMFIRVGQGGAAGSGDPKMFQFPLTASQTSGNLPEGMSSTQLTEKHGYKLSPAGESPSMPLGFRFSDGLLELDSRKQL